MDITYILQMNEVLNRIYNLLLANALGLLVPSPLVRKMLSLREIYRSMDSTMLRFLSNENQNFYLRQYQRMFRKVAVFFARIFPFHK